MPRFQLLYQNDISEAAGNIRSYFGDLTFEKFKNDRMGVNAVVRNFEVIGEAVKNPGEDLKVQFPATDWKAVADFRDTLTHRYFGIDLEILWNSIVHKIPVLHKEIAVIIAHEKAKNT